MVSVGLEDVGGHLSVVTDVILELLKLLLLKGQRCCLGECNGFQLHQSFFPPMSPSDELASFYYACQPYFSMQLN